MSNLGVATYNNTEILGIKSIEVVTSSNGNTGVIFYNEDKETIGTIGFTERQSNRLLLNFKDTIKQVNVSGCVICFGDIGHCEIKGPVYLGEGNIAIKGCKKEDFEISKTNKFIAEGIVKDGRYDDSIINICGNIESLISRSDRVRSDILYNINNVNKIILNGRLYAALTKSNSISLNKGTTDYFYMTPLNLRIIENKKNDNYIIYPRTILINCNNKKFMSYTLRYLKHYMGNVGVVEENNDSIVIENLNFDNNTWMNEYNYACNIFYYLEEIYLKTHLNNGWFYSNNVVFKVIISKSDLMESDLLLNKKHIGKTEKNKIVDSFIYALRNKVYERYIKGKAVGSNELNCEATKLGFEIKL